MFFLFRTSKIKQALRKGAIVIDVRTVHEYDQGKVRGSVHIPIDRIATSIARIKQMQKPIVFCAGGDSRSARAVSMLKQAGLKEVYNGGSWEQVIRIINHI